MKRYRIVRFTVDKKVVNVPLLWIKNHNGRYQCWWPMYGLNKKLRNCVPPPLEIDYEEIQKWKLLDCTIVMSQEFLTYEEGDSAISVLESYIGSTSTPNHSHSKNEDVACGSAVVESLGSEIPVGSVASGISKDEAHNHNVYAAVVEPLDSGIRLGSVDNVSGANERSNDEVIVADVAIVADEADEADEAIVADEASRSVVVSSVLSNDESHNNNAHAAIVESLDNGIRVGSDETIVEDANVAIVADVASRSVFVGISNDEAGKNFDDDGEASNSESEDDGAISLEENYQRAIGLEENYQRASDMFDIARSLKIVNPATYESFQTMLENEGFGSLKIFYSLILEDDVKKYINKMIEQTFETSFVVKTLVFRDIPERINFESSNILACWKQLLMEKWPAQFLNEASAYREIFNQFKRIRGNYNQSEGRRKKKNIK